MEYKMSQLEGALLDAAVALAEGWAPHLEPVEHWLRQEGRYSTEWRAGGPIIERERIELRYLNDGWNAVFRDRHGRSIDYYGTNYKTLGTGQWINTPLIAAMRVYVASKFGDRVELPEALNSPTETKPA